MSDIAMPEGSEEEKVPSLKSIDNSSHQLALLDWDGPTDTGNPKNWPLRKKIFHTAIPAFYGFAV